MSGFTAETYQNEYLPAGAAEVNAIVTVTSSGGGATVADAASTSDGATADAGAAEIVIVDTSGSMHVPRGKLQAAKYATAAAIDCIRDGVDFGVIAGTDSARVVYPASGGLAVASDSTRADAKIMVARLKADGGTAMGAWLALAKDLFGTSPNPIKHAILLTDGQNEHEAPEHLDEVLADCEGNFQCDCRGVGTDWEVSELRRIASALLGSVDIIAEPSGLEADFRSLIEQAMGKATSNVALRLWTPQGASVAL